MDYSPSDKLVRPRKICFFTPSKPPSREEETGNNRMGRIDRKGQRGGLILPILFTRWSLASLRLCERTSVLGVSADEQFG